MPHRQFYQHDRTREIGRLLRELRVARSLSVREVARKAKCSPSFLSQVEKGNSSPSLESLERIASAFDLSVLELLNLARERGPALKVCAGSKGQTFTSWVGGHLSHLLPAHVAAVMSLLVLDLEPQARTSLRVARQAMKELGVVLAGKVECQVGGVTHQLKAGDALYFDLITPHSWKNTGKKHARVLLVNPNFTQVFDVEEA
jgi:quercetin dioxygenase-like cupin family protein